MVIQLRTCRQATVYLVQLVVVAHEDQDQGCKAPNRLDQDLPQWVVVAQWLNQGVRWVRRKVMILQGSISQDILLFRLDKDLDHHIKVGLIKVSTTSKAGRIHIQRVMSTDGVIVMVTTVIRTSGRVAQAKVTIGKEMGDIVMSNMVNQVEMIMTMMTNIIEVTVTTMTGSRISGIMNTMETVSGVENALCQKVRAVGQVQTLRGAHLK